MTTVGGVSLASPSTGSSGSASGAGSVDATGSGSASGSTSVYGLDQDAFFKLFLAQLQNQDPTSPMDETQMVSQLAQFSMIEMLQQLTTAMQGSQLAQASSLIGRTVSGTSAGGQPVTGVVDSVQQTASGLSLTVDGQSVDATKVTTVGSPSSSSGAVGGTTASSGVS